MRSEPILFEQLPVGRKSLRIAVVTETYPPEVNGVAMTLRGAAPRFHLCRVTGG